MTITLKKPAGASTLPASTLAFPSTLTLTPSSLQTLAQAKDYATGGSRTSMNFTFGLALNATNRLAIYFSRIYPEGLGLDSVVCYNGNWVEVFCSVSGRTLTVKFLEGRVLYVEGIIQAIDYSSS
jgi:hypothetical protein